MSEANLVNPITTDTTVCTMSRTYRKVPTHLFRSPQTHNELKQQYFDSDGYGCWLSPAVSRHKRYIPTNYDDIHVSAYKQLDHQ